MALNRDLTVRLNVDGNADAKFKSAEASARSLARELDRLEGEQRRMAQAESAAYREMEQRSEARRQAMDKTGKVLLGLGAAAALGVGAAVKVFATFDAAMSNVQAATGETEASMKRLREAALQAGADTAFSATEAAAGIENLAKAGVSTADILGGRLKGALDLAAAGQLDVGQAAEFAATALTQFDLSGRDVSRVADLLSAGAGKAQGGVTELGQALAQSGLVASQTGLTIEETTGALAAFASAGLLGSDAGTSFKTMLQRLSAPSGEAADLLGQLGVNAYDAQGNFVGLADLSGDLRDALDDLTPAQRNAALATIFGSDAVRAASVLYDQGEDGIRQWISAVDDQGYAADQAAMRLDNLKGDIEALGGALETALISAAEGSDGPLRGAVQRVEALVNVFNDAPPVAQQATLAVGGVTAAVGLTGGAALIAVPKIYELYTALGDMGGAGARAQRGMRGLGTLLMGPWGVALAAGTIALGIWAEKQYQSRHRVEELTATLDDQTGAFTDNTRAKVDCCCSVSRSSRKENVRLAPLRVHLPFPVVDLRSWIMTMLAWSLGLWLVASCLLAPLTGATLRRLHE